MESLKRISLGVLVGFPTFMATYIFTSLVLQ